jgi:hypothetical protein
MTTVPPAVTIMRTAFARAVSASALGSSRSTTANLTALNPAVVRVGAGRCWN